MPGETPKPSREERLAAQLRANLRRRKAQARALSDPGPDHAPLPLCEHEVAAREENERRAALSKPPPAG